MLIISAFHILVGLFCIFIGAVFLDVCWTFKRERDYTKAAGFFLAAVAAAGVGGGSIVVQLLKLGVL